ncbi:phage holin family protein [Aquipseudomonas ullengensis]|uniref:Phage holin family protein n=1 Tax=Aquipseudomonas ullengensis TaxID=2759166 RepID=A0A7W4LMG7_9GAMM|nr:phage holin family protein [Pseudomonas ullengensis]MBB2495850.1 phage holin family protein [Pseudomonas ullengensis]
MSQTPPPGASAIGQSPSLTRLAAAFLGLLHGHVELFGSELQEEKTRSLRLLLLAGLALVFGLLLLLGLSALVLILAWEDYRQQAILGLCLFYALATLYCAVRLYRALDEDVSPFSATLEELARDRERLLP